MIRLTTEQFARTFGKRKSPDSDKRPLKYRNKKCEWMGARFDSIAERDRFIVLEDMQRHGKISGLRRQVRFELIPEHRENGELIERRTDYIADFVYRDERGVTVVEDVKGYRKNPVWIMKRKLMLEKYGIRVREV